MTNDPAKTLIDGILKDAKPGSEQELIAEAVTAAVHGFQDKLQEHMVGGDIDARMLVYASSSVAASLLYTFGTQTRPSDREQVFTYLAGVVKDGCVKGWVQGVREFDNG